ncbi:MAG: S-layer homology domain-containing protein, partial [Faecousia sp.]
STYAYDAMVWAVQEGIIGGMDGKLAPKDNATRAQIAMILYRYLNK